MNCSTAKPINNDEQERLALEEAFKEVGGLRWYNLDLKEKLNWLRRFEAHYGLKVQFTIENLDWTMNKISSTHFDRKSDRSLKVAS